MQRLRLCPTAVTWARLCATTSPFSKDAREKLTKTFAAVKEETRGQALDLTDMSDASRKLMRQMQDTLKQFPQVEQDPKVKGKIQTLNASLKAYNTRLSTLQNEARSMQAEVDGLMKAMWGAETPSTAPMPGGATMTKQESDIGGDDHMEAAAAAPVSAASSPSSGGSRTVETVEGEIVRDSSSSKAARGAQPQADAEIEIESIDIEPPAEAAGAPSSSAVSSSSSSSSGISAQVEAKSVTEITRELHEKGVSFSDCMDAKSLRLRYQHFLDGKVGAPKKAATPPPPPPPQQQQSTPARRPANNTYYDQQSQQQQQQQQQTPNSSEKGLATDPYPGAERRMIDPMKYVYQVKQEICAEKGVDPNQVDIWSGKLRLDDSKRIMDFPSVQNFPMELRQKGNAPAGAYN